MNPRLAPSGCRSQQSPILRRRGEGCRMSSLPSHTPSAAALTSRCKIRLPCIDQTPRSESIRSGDLEAMTKSKCDTLKKGVTPMTPPLHIQKATKAAPTDIAVEAFAKDPYRECRGKKPDPLPSILFNAAVPPPTVASSEGR